MTGNKVRLGILHAYNPSGVVGRDSDGCGKVLLLGYEGKGTLYRRRDGQLVSMDPTLIVIYAVNRAALPNRFLPESESKSFQSTQLVHGATEV